MFTIRSKSTATVVGFLSVFIFTLTSNVIFEPPAAWAEDVSQRDTESETAGASKEAKGKLAGAADSATGFFGGIIGWIKGVTNAVNEMWGMENGSGVAMVVNGLFYLLLATGFLFAGKMVFNIIKDSVGGKVDERYEKPSFRKK